MITPLFRRIVVGIAAMAIASATLVACDTRSTNAGYYDTLCVNPTTQIRMPDYYCTAGTYYHPSWVYYVPLGYAAPAYGVHVSHYTVNHYHRPANATIHKGGVPSNGGKAKRYSTGNSKVNLNKPKSRVGGGSVYKPKTRIGGGYKPRSGRR